MGVLETPDHKRAIPTTPERVYRRCGDRFLFTLGGLCLALDALDQLMRRKVKRDGNAPNRFKVWLLRAVLDHGDMASRHSNQPTEHLLRKPSLTPELVNRPCYSHVVKVYHRRHLLSTTVMAFSCYIVYEDRQIYGFVVRFHARKKRRPKAAQIQSEAI